MRTEVNTIQIFKLSELSEEAQEKAFERWNQYADFDNQFILDDYQTILECLGFSDIKIYYSGFWSQGDGACFTGYYQYKKGWKKELKEYCDYQDIIDIGMALQELQSKYFYRLQCSIEHNGYRHYHENSVLLLLDNDNISDYDSVESELLSIVQDISRVIYKALESEYEHQTSIGFFVDACEANQYEFLSNGVML
jgi:cell fate (sporulation/competence/biofilm development) regulator YlbF (YheA/YmcA/DUF963 family)